VKANKVFQGIFYLYKLFLQNYIYFTGIKHSGTCGLSDYCLSGYMVTGWTKWLKLWTSRPEFLEFFLEFSLQNPTQLRKANVTILYKTTYVWQKKIFSQNFSFFEQLSSRIYTKLRPNLKKWSAFLQIVFKSFIRSPFGCDWIDFYSFAWKVLLNFSILQKTITFRFLINFWGFKKFTFSLFSDILMLLFLFIREVFSNRYMQVLLIRV
jgi:hypothetical protein